MQFLAQYESGYLAADGENIFLSSSDNWPYISSLKEGAENNNRQDSHGTTRIIGIIGPILVLIFFLIKRDMKGKDMSYIWLFIIPVVAVVIYRMIKPQQGPECKIPIEKITAFTIDIDRLHLEFLDSEGKEDELDLKGFEAEKLKELRLILLGDEMDAVNENMQD